MRQILGIVRERYLALLVPMAVAVVISSLVTAARSRGPAVHEAWTFVEAGHGQLSRVSTHITHRQVAARTIRFLTEQEDAQPFAGFLEDPPRSDAGETAAEARARELIQHLEVRPAGSNLIEVRLRMSGTGPLYPAKVLRAHLWVAQTLRRHAEGRTPSWEETELKRRLNAARSRVDDARRDLANFYAKYRGADPQSELEALHQRRRQIRKHLDEIAARLQGARARQRSLEQEGKDLKPYQPLVLPVVGQAAGSLPPRTKALAALNAHKATLEKRLAELLRAVTEAHPEARDMRRRISETDGRIVELEAWLQPRTTEQRISERYEANRRALAEVRTESARLLAERAKLTQQAAAINQQVPLAETAALEYRKQHGAREHALRVAEARLIDQTRNQAALEGELLLAQGRRGIDQSRALTLRALTNMPQISAAPARPPGMRPAFIIFVAGLLGLVIGAFFAWSRERARGVVRSPQQLQQALGAPVLGVLDEQAIVEPHWGEARAHVAQPAEAASGLWVAIGSMIGLGVLGAFVYLMTLWAIGELGRETVRTLSPAEQRLMQQELGPVSLPPPEVPPPPSIAQPARPGPESRAGPGKSGAQPPPVPSPASGPASSP